MLCYKKLAAVILFVTSHSVYASQENQQAIVSFDRFQTETLKKDQIETSKKYQTETSKKDQFDEVKTTKRAHVKLEDQLAGYRELEKKRDVSVRYSAFFAKMPIEVMSMIVAANNVGERNVIPDLPEDRMPWATRRAQMARVEHARAEMAREERQLVAIRDLRSLACVNKALNKLVNDGQVVETFITSMADRDDVSKVNIAGLMQTKGAKVWLNNYADTSGEYETFKATKKIITKLEDFSDQVNQYDWKMKLNLIPVFSFQTKEGLMLEVDIRLSHLYTPWGRISIPECYEMSNRDNDRSNGSPQFIFRGKKMLNEIDLFITQEVFQGITAHIKETRGFDICGLRFVTAEQYIAHNADSSFYTLNNILSLDDIKNRLLKDYQQAIPLKAVEASKGKKLLIISDDSNLGCLYEVHAVDGQLPLPDSKLASRKEEKSEKVANAMWKLMNKKFEEEERIKLVKKQVLIELLAKNSRLYEPIFYIIFCLLFALRISEN